MSRDPVDEYGIWEHRILVQDDGTPHTPETFGAYMRDAMEATSKTSFSNAIRFVLGRASYDGQHADICIVGNGLDGERNARLIAAAPMLLWAVQRAAVGKLTQLEAAALVTDVLNGDWRECHKRWTSEHAREVQAAREEGRKAGLEEAADFLEGHKRQPKPHLTGAGAEMRRGVLAWAVSAIRAISSKVLPGGAQRDA